MCGASVLENNLLYTGKKPFGSGTLPFGRVEVAVKISSVVKGALRIDIWSTESLGKFKVSKKPDMPISVGTIVRSKFIADIFGVVQFVTLSGLENVWNPLF